MEKNWTIQQIDAIKSNNNVFISASAGSGKTSVLVERIIYQIINNKKNILNFLVLTYTKKAAYEIKSRLLDRLYLLLDDVSLNNTKKKYILEQIILLPNADITTIHSFCFKLIKEKNAILNINDVEINDSIYNEINIIEKEKLIKYLCQQDELFTKQNLFIKYDNILNICNSLYEKSQLNIEPKKYLLNIKNIYNINNIYFWIKKSQEQILTKITFVKNILEYLKYKDLLLNKLINRLLNYDIKSHDNFIALCEDIIKTEIHQQNNHIFYKIINKIFAEIKNILYKKEDIIKDTKIHYLYINILINCVIILYQNRDIQNKNFLENIPISFADVEHLVINLINENLINDIYYTDIIIDEYQDTNEVQDYILKNIKCNNYFYVGDIKQCIYEFRSANINIFKEKISHFVKMNKNNNKLNKFISLNKNFRSTNEIIRTINKIFLFIMNKNFSDIDYNNELLLENNNTGKYKVEIDILNNDINQMKYISTKIKNIIDHDPLIKAQDIVVLFRSLNNQKNLFLLEESLIKYGFDMICNKQNKFINQIEIKTIINLIRIIINPYDDLYLIGCLISPLFSFNMNEIYEIQQFNNTNNFYENLINIKNMNNKYKKFVDILEKLRSKNFLLSKLIDKIYDLTSAVNIFGEMTNGDIRQKNLNNFILIAQKYDNKYDSINYFIEKIDDMIKNNEDFIDIKFEEKNENSISVMSIHQAKGLEFNVVILAEIDKKFNIKDANQKIIIHEKHGIGVKYETIIDNKIYSNASIIYDFIQQNILYDNLKEEVRILYVALTRSMKKLVIIGKCNNIEQKIKYWSCFINKKILVDFILKESSSYLPLILMPFIKNEKLSSTKDTKIRIITNFNEDILYKKKNIKSKEKNFDIINLNKIPHKINYFFSCKNLLKSNSQIKSKITASSNNIYNLRSWTLNGNNYSMKLGNEYHKIMQFIKFENNINYEHINNEIDRLIKLNILNKNLSLNINRNLILNFFKSNLYKEILCSKKIWREFRFTIVETLDKNSPLIQGIIDMIYIYNNKINIIDFKSDKILYNYDFYIKKYTNQLNIYHNAVNQIFKMPFDKKILYFLNTGEYVCI